MAGVLADNGLTGRSSVHRSLAYERSENVPQVGAATGGGKFREERRHGVELGMAGYTHEGTGLFCKQVEGAQVGYKQKPTRPKGLIGPYVSPDSTVLL